MDIKYASDDMKSACNDTSAEQKGLRKIIKSAKAPHEPEDVVMVLNALRAASTIEDLPPMFRYHLLKHNLSGCGAVDVKTHGSGGRGKWRMVFKVISDCDDINKKSSIKEIIIQKLLEDYHK